MKATATKWPVSVTVELADDYSEGLAPGSFTEDNFILRSQLQNMADQLAQAYISAKGKVLALQEATRKQNK